mmetsp:Transcript_9656/g.15811  ORF Transcript_9656/g.15811 Transcript_9656/m.15811 type:complete len:80 (-) Transcript_9656:526-765(-)
MLFLSMHHDMFVHLTLLQVFCRFDKLTSPLASAILTNSFKAAMENIRQSPSDARCPPRPPPPPSSDSPASSMSFKTRKM